MYKVFTVEKTWGKSLTKNEQLALAGFGVNKSEQVNILHGKLSTGIYR